MRPGEAHVIESEMLPSPAMVELTASDNRGGAGLDAGAIKLVCFLLHGQEYAIDIGQVKETLALRPITRVFLTPSWLAGIVNLRGDIVPILDLADLCGLSPTDINAESRIIILSHGAHMVGVVVDELAELRMLATGDIQPVPATVTGDAAAIMTGVATVEDGAALRLLDLDALFESERLRALQRGGS